MSADEARIKQLLDAAAALPPQERALFVREQCVDDLNLLSTIEQRLAIEPAYSTTLSTLHGGQVVGNRYEIIRLLGRGGMGEVYAANDRMLGEPVALKTLRADIASRDDIVRRFRREIQLARKVTHPNVSRIFEVGEIPSRSPQVAPIQYFTMEFLNGETLSARIRRKGKLGKDEAFSIACQMADGLAAAHEAGIVHTDFKSGNVMLVTTSSGDRAVITDFGLARFDPRLVSSSQVETVTESSRLVGTVGYMSPEQLTNGKITVASDIYSFGIVLYEMATGNVPFDTRHPIRAAVERMSETGKSLRGRLPDLDPRWEGAILRCLQPDPAKRFASALELGDMFRDEGARRNIAWGRREWMKASAAAAVTVTAVGGGWTWYTRPYVPSQEAMQWHLKGQLALQSMAYESARRAFEQAARADPLFAVAHASLARAYDELDYSELSKGSMLRALDVASRSRPSRLDTKRLRAIQLTVERDFENAVSVYRDLESLAPDKVSAMIDTGWALEQSDQAESAIASYRRALQADPANAAAKLRLTINLRRSGKLSIDDALTDLAETEMMFRAASNYEGVVATILQRGTILNRSQRYADAGKIIDQGLAIAAATSNASAKIDLQLLMSVVLRNMGETTKSGVLAQSAVEEARANGLEGLAASGLTDLANVYQARGEPQMAEVYFRQGLEAATRNRNRRTEARARLALGSHLKSTARPKEAEPLIRQALVFYDQRGYQLQKLQGAVLLTGIIRDRGDLIEAEKLIRNVLPTADQQKNGDIAGQTHQMLGSVLALQGNLPAALAEAQKATSLQKGALAIYDLLDCGVLFSRLGQTKEAEAMFHEADIALAKVQGAQTTLHERLSYHRATDAYSRGLIPVARLHAVKTQALAQSLPGEEENVEFLLGLCDIRSGQVEQGLRKTRAILSSPKGYTSVAGLAERQLALAEALVATKHKAEAADFAASAAAFFEPRQVWESLWRCRWVVATSKGSDLSSVREVTARIKAVWPQSSLESYGRFHPPFDGRG